MGQYQYHVFACTSGKTCPLDGSVAVHAALKQGAAAPSDNKVVERDPAP